MLSLLANYFLHATTGNESKIASFTEITFQEEATREVLNTAFCVSAPFTELQNHKTIQAAPVWWEVQSVYCSLLLSVEAGF